MKVYQLKSKILNLLYPYARFIYAINGIKKDIVNNIEPAIKTLEDISKSKISLCRYGDGELDIIRGKAINFPSDSLAFSFKQNNNAELSECLSRILKSSEKDLYIGIPDVFCDIQEKYIDEMNYKFWILHLLTNRRRWILRLSQNTKYCNQLLFSISLFKEFETNPEGYIKVLKEIFMSRDIVIIEGEHTKLGVGYNYLNNANSVQRILCPSQNAWDIYDQIMEKSKTFDINSLFLIVLGPTATVLAYDLHLLGYQAIDIGQIDFRIGKHPSLLNAPLTVETYILQISCRL